MRPPNACEVIQALWYCGALASASLWLRIYVTRVNLPNRSSGAAMSATEGSVARRLHVDVVFGAWIETGVRVCVAAEAAAGADASRSGVLLELDVELF